MKLELEVRIAPGGVAMTAVELAALLPGLQIGVAPAIERAPTSFVGRLVLDDDDEVVKRAVAQQLDALKAFSIQFPTSTITISADGGELRLEAGDFGADADEIAALLAEVSADEPWQLLVAFRIEPDAHRHVRDLVERAVPARLAPIIDESPGAVAFGFTLTGEARHVADLVGCLRLAWRQEGSDAECVVEVEGARPVVTVVRTWADWVDLERSLRKARTEPREAGAAAQASQGPMLLVDVAEATRVLGEQYLSWIDADDQILCLVDGRMYTLPERVELGSPTQGEVLRGGRGSLVFAHGERRLEVPPAADDAERLLHAVIGGVLVLSDTRGAGNHARTRLVRVTTEAVEHGPELVRVRAIDLVAEGALALADGRAGLALLSIELGRGWGYTESRPWRDDERATDLAAIGSTRVAITAERDQRSTLYLLERANLVYGRTIALPCTAPEIVGHDARTVWITGMSASASPARCDLFRVDLPTGKVIIETGEIHSAAIDVVVAARGDAAVLTTKRAVYLAGAEALCELVELGHDEHVTGIACLPTPAAFLHGPRGARLVLGRERVVVHLKSPGYVPRSLRARPV